jgi:hypothetical protein
VLLYVRVIFCPVFLTVKEVDRLSMSGSNVEDVNWLLWDVTQCRLVESNRRFGTDR